LHITVPLYMLGKTGKDGTAVWSPLIRN